MSNKPVRENVEESPLAGLNFRFPLRRYQQEIIELTRLKLERGERQLHIVAPPGAGKTIIGLQLAALLEQNTLIISPTTTIQAQWGEKLDLFLRPGEEAFGTEHLLGTHESMPLKPITLLTYQVLSTPGREQEYLEKLAHKSWVDELTGSGMSQGDAEIRILELLQNNKKAHEKELSRHVTRLRRKLSEVLDLKEVLHKNALELIQALRRQKFKTVIFDECHHLTDYWAAIMTHVVSRLDDAVIVGLTGTPPEGKSQSQENRYLSLVGEIDYQVPTPALVREGGLAPFQDLVYFTLPTADEEQFLAGQHAEFHKLLQELSEEELLLEADGKRASPHAVGAMPCVAPPFGDEALDEAPKVAEGTVEVAKGKSAKGAAKLHSGKAENGTVKVTKVPAPGTDPGGSVLTRWVEERVAKACQDGWKSFASKCPDLSCAYIRYLYRQSRPLPDDVEYSEALLQSPFIDDWMCLLEEFSLYYLKTSASTESHKLYDRIKTAVGRLGYGLTETGLRKQASPVDRVLAFSKGKSRAVAEILDVEYRNLQDRLRAAVVTDFERMSATAAKQTKGVLTEDSGGAIAVLRELLKTNVSQFVNPCLVTGSLILLDNRIAQQVKAAIEEMLRADGHDFELELCDHPGDDFSQLKASSSQWEPRLYVGLATRVLERGITKVLIGTRGIFGEGWDCQSLNTLVDLTTTTTPVSVKQLRGRSIRINASDPLGARKVANNWDVVCIAPHLEKGLNDYQRFARKHSGYFGICDDGQVECGVGHVHPSFSELSPAEVFANLDEFNQEMKLRALAREGIYNLWKVGEPYSNKTLGCVEIGRLRKLALTPPHIRRDLSYPDHARLMRANLNGVYLEYGGLGAVVSGVTCLLMAHLSFPLALSLLPFVGACAMAVKRHNVLYNKLKKEICQTNTQESALMDMGRTILSALQHTKMLPAYLTKDAIRITLRSDGSYRVFLDEVDEQQSQHFVKCFKELMQPVRNQPFLIPKYEYSLPAPRTRNGRKQIEQDDVQADAGGLVTAGGRVAGNGMNKKNGSAAPAKLNLIQKDGQTVLKLADAGDVTSRAHAVAGVGDHADTEGPEDGVVNSEKAESEERFFKSYLKGRAEPRIAAYYPVPSLLARSEKGREAFQSAWNKFVSPGFIVSTETKPELLNRYFGMGASLAQRLLWE